MIMYLVKAGFIFGVGPLDPRAARHVPAVMIYAWLFVGPFVTAEVQAQEPPRKNPFGDLTEGLDQLLEEPKREASETEASPAAPGREGFAGKAVEEVLQWMRNASESLSAGDAGTATQQAQRTVIQTLDDWLGAGEQSRQEGATQSSETQQQSQEPGDASQRESAQEEAGENRSEEAGSETKSEEETQGGGQGAPSESPSESGGDESRGQPPGSQSSDEASQREAEGEGKAGVGPSREGAAMGSGGRIGRAGTMREEVSGETAAAGDVWGHLPPRVRDSLRAVGPQDYLPEYRAAIEAYFKQLAESAQ